MKLIKVGSVYYGLSHIHHAMAAPDGSVTLFFSEDPNGVRVKLTADQFAAMIAQAGPSTVIDLGEGETPPKRTLKTF